MSEERIDTISKRLTQTNDTAVTIAQAPSTSAAELLADLPPEEAARLVGAPSDEEAPSLHRATGKHLA
jgi:hypothetical protein